MWDAETGKPLGESLRGHSHRITAVAFSPDGSRIVSSSWDRTIRLWDAETGEMLGEPLVGHVSIVESVRFSPDGLRIVSGSRDGTIRLWTAHNAALATKVNQDDTEHSSLTEDVEGTPLEISVPGFKQCSLSHNGWVKSSAKYLFWVPPNNRNGLIYRHLLTLPLTSPYRATRLDFTRFQCGDSWTNVRSTR
ncbi:related to WD40-repeat protein (notchless protein) [Serendipita indica DSM 11827]|uniref:Related to WD40-repeat protein (Notchless protein) n=1 Tax=Serendipita indica (strain DSM 11827) TaxID=1109443 RepID=G4U2K6_SERID|nr:related to WD40-repeat protein (notchless protein) [Serendipita indica DSM 11827]